MTNPTPDPTISPRDGDAPHPSSIRRGTHFRTVGFGARALAIHLEAQSPDHPRSLLLYSAHTRDEERVYRYMASVRVQRAKELVQALQDAIAELESPGRHGWGGTPDPTLAAGPRGADDAAPAPRLPVHDAGPRCAGQARRRGPPETRAPGQPPSSWLEAQIAASKPSTEAT